MNGKQGLCQEGDFDSMDWMKYGQELVNMMCS
jgi:hypothetical protein